MRLDEATQILKNAGYLVEYTSMYSALSDFYRYLKIKVPKTGYDLDIEGDENSITVKFMGNVAKVTLEQFDEDEDPMLYVEVEDDERAFYNEHTDYGNALQFIIKNICPTNESVNESTNDYREIITKKLAQIYDNCYDSDDAGRSYAEKHVAEFEPQIAEVLEEGGDSPISPYEVAEVIWYMLHHSQLMGKSILGVYWRYTRNEPDYFESWYQFNP